MKQPETYRWFFDPELGRAIRVKEDTKNDLVQYLKDWAIGGFFVVVMYCIVTIAFLFDTKIIN